MPQLQTISIRATETTIKFDSFNTLPNIVTIKTDPDAFLKTIDEQLDACLIDVDDLMKIIIEQVKPCDAETADRILKQSRLEELIHVYTSALASDEEIPA